VRVLLAVQLALWSGTLWVLGGALAAAVDRWPRLQAVDRSDEERARAARAAGVTLAVLLAAAGGNPFVIKLFVNGLESGVVALVAALLLAAALRMGVDGWLSDAGPTPRGESGDALAQIESEDQHARARTRRLEVGALLALAILARTDGIVLTLALAVWCFPDAVRRGRVGFTAFRELIQVPVVAIIVYSGFNLAVFGNPMQISGVTKRLPLTGGRLAVAATFAAASVAVGWATRWLATRPTTSIVPGRFARTRTYVGRTGWFAAGCVLQLGYYQVLSAETYLWYYAPIGLYLLGLFLHAAADLFEGAIIEAPEKRSLTAALRPMQAILAVPLFAGFVLTGKVVTDPHASSLAEGDRAAAEWADAHLPDDAVLASWDAGVVGYFANRPVVNLDGVVNSFEWRDARLAGTNATTRFLRDRHVTHVVNHGFTIDGEDPDLRDRIDGLLGDGAGHRLTLVHRVDVVYDGTLGGVDASGRPVATFVYEVDDKDRFP
jgi:hypothetical protein